MELWYSKAVRRPVSYIDSLPMLDLSRPTLVAHTNGGGSNRGSLYDWFNRPGNDIAAHLQIMWDGTVEQYIPFDRVAYAQYAANRFAWSAEHQDDGNNMRPFTSAQLMSFRAVAIELGVKFTLAPDTGGGIGYHSLYADWNRSGHDCTGSVRAAQISKLIAAGAVTTPVGASPLLARGCPDSQKVADVQHALDLLGNETQKIDGRGHFGAETDRVLRVFQDHRGLPVTGTTTPTVWRLLRQVAHPAA